MSKLKLPPRRKYKTNASYLDAVYKKNKTLIDSTLPDTHLSKRQMFIDLVKEQKQSKSLKRILDKEKVSTIDAIKAIDRSRIFTSLREQMLENARKALKSTGAEEELKKITGKKRILIKDLSYDREENVYMYKDVKISFKKYNRSGERSIQIYK